MKKVLCRGDLSLEMYILVVILVVQVKKVPCRADLSLEMYILVVILVVQVKKVSESGRIRSGVQFYGTGHLTSLILNGTMT